MTLAGTLEVVRCTVHRALVRAVSRATPEATRCCATGAGFYVNATQEPWNANFHMYDYVTKELPEVVAANFAVDTSNGALPVWLA